MHGAVGQNGHAAVTMKPIAAAPRRAVQAYEAIRDGICDGSLEAGARLVQEELAAALDVSRQPIQQALALLKSDGLIVESGARGLYVAPLDPDGTAQRYQIRLVLDELAARLVAERAAASPQFGEELRREGAAMLEKGWAAAGRGADREAVAFDVAFHSFLYDMSGNPLIRSTADPHWNYVRRAMIGVMRHAKRGDIVWRQHGEILDALARGDVEGGVERAGAHVRGAQRALFASIAETTGAEPPTARNAAP